MRLSTVPEGRRGGDGQHISHWKTEAPRSQVCLTPCPRILPSSWGCKGRRHKPCPLKLTGFPLPERGCEPSCDVMCVKRPRRGHRPITSKCHCLLQACLRNPSAPAQFKDSQAWGTFLLSLPALRCSQLWGAGERRQLGREGVEKGTSGVPVVA